MLLYMPLCIKYTAQEHNKKHIEKHETYALKNGYKIVRK